MSHAETHPCRAAENGGKCCGGCKKTPQEQPVAITKTPAPPAPARAGTAALAEVNSLIRSRRMRAGA